MNEQNIDISKDSNDALFVMQLALPENNPVALKGLQKGSGGDGTVPVSSGAALNVLESADVTKDDESYLVRDHEPIFKTKTALDYDHRQPHHLSHWTLHDSSAGKHEGCAAQCDFPIYRDYRIVVALWHRSPKSATSGLG